MQNPDLSLLGELCASCDLLVLARSAAADGILDAIGALPSWLSTFFTVPLPVFSEQLFAQRFPFFENFLVDAAAAWASCDPRGVDSEIWSETTDDGSQLLLQSFALSIGGRQLLIIDGSQHRLRDRETLLQLARQGQLAHERLQRDTEKRDILFHCIVHDLATPLSTIRSALQMLLKESLSPATSELVQICMRAALKQDALVREVLDIFRGDLDGWVTERPCAEAADLCACSREVLRLLTPAAAFKKVTLRLEPPNAEHGSLPVLGDSARLERVLANLCENALRYAPRNTAVVVTLNEGPADVLVTVDDEGPGVSVDAQATLFAKIAPDRRGSGKIGLGLYFCRMTIERWQGSIGFSPREQRGARFWFRLPRMAQLPSEKTGVYKSIT